MTLEGFTRYLGKVYFLVVLWNICSAQQTATSQNVIINPDGSYHFSYDTGAGPHKSYRTETKTADGQINGSYGYVDPDGKLRITEYVADTNGYRSQAVVYQPVYRPPNNVLVVGPLPQRSAKKEPEAPPPPLTSLLGPLPPRISSPRKEFIIPDGELQAIDTSLLLPPDPLILIGPIPKHLQNSLGSKSSRLNTLDVEQSFSNNPSGNSVVKFLTKKDSNDENSVNGISDGTEASDNSISASNFQSQENTFDNRGNMDISFGTKLDIRQNSPKASFQSMRKTDQTLELPVRTFQPPNGLVPSDIEENSNIFGHRSNQHLLEYLLPSLK